MWDVTGVSASQETHAGCPWVDFLSFGSLRGFPSQQKGLCGNGFAAEKGDTKCSVKLQQVCDLT